MKTYYHWIRAVIVAGLPLMSGHAQAADSAVELRSGVLVSDEAVYLMQPGGGIEAVALKSGASLWTTDEADLPVAADGAAVLARRESAAPGELSLVTLEPVRGEVVARSAVALPKGVTASIDDQLNSRFALSADASRDDRLVWRYETRDVRGALDDAATAAPVRDAGVLALSSDRRRVTALTTERVPADRPAVRRTLTTDFAPADARSFVSEDGAHVLLSRKRGASEYRWDLRGRNGDALGDVPSHLAFSPFVVRDGLVLFVAPPRARRVNDALVGEPRLLTAVALSTGDVVWTRPVRQTDYGGPFPH